MTDQPHFVRDVICKLQSKAQAAADRHASLRHMLVLPPGERILIPPPFGNRPVGTRSGRQKLRTCKFGETEVVGPLPPRTSWPKGMKPWRAVVAEQGSRPNEETPYRVHLFFGDGAGALNVLKRLADDLDGIHSDVARAIYGDHSSLPREVFFTPGDHLRSDRVARLDSWLCTMHWWAWHWTECTYRTRPRVVYAGSTHETDPDDDSVRSKLAYSIFDADVLTASADTLSLILRFLNEPPSLLPFGEYPNVPEPDERLAAIGSTGDTESRDGAAGVGDGTDQIDGDGTASLEGEATPSESATESIGADGLSLGEETESRSSLVDIGEWNELTDRQRNCMRALHEFGAFDADSRRRAKVIAVKAEGPSANANGFKAPLANLVSRRIVECKAGREGGYWLAGSGLAHLIEFDSGFVGNNPSS